MYFHAPSFYINYYIGRMWMELGNRSGRDEQQMEGAILLQQAAAAVCEDENLEYSKVKGNPFTFLLYLAQQKMVCDASCQIRLLSEQLNLMKNYLETQEREMEQVRRFQHDMKNHYIGLSGLLDQGEIESAKAYVNQLYAKTAADQIAVHTGNPVMDALLSEKIGKARSLGIPAESYVMISRQMAIDVIDWSILLGNSLDNAIEANMGLKETKRSLFIQIRSQGMMLHICIRNACCGYTEVETTSKPDKRNHGFGMGNMRRVVEKYNGLLSHETQNGYFTLTILLCGV